MKNEDIISERISRSRAVFDTLIKNHIDSGGTLEELAEVASERDYQPRQTIEPLILMMLGPSAPKMTVSAADSDSSYQL